MSKGIDVESFNKRATNKNSLSKTSINTKSGNSTGKVNFDDIEFNKRRAKGGSKGGTSFDSGQVLDGGIRIASEVIGLIKTISQEKETTAREKENTKRVKIASDERVREIESDLIKHIGTMKVEIEKCKEEASIAIRESDNETKIQLRDIERKERLQEQEHQQRMAIIKMHTMLLEELMELYKIYFQQKMSGMTMSPGEEDICKKVGLFIQQMQSVSLCLSNNQQIIDTIGYGE